MQSNNILQAIRDKRLILALYERIQNFQIEMRRDYKEYLKKQGIRDVIGLISLFLIFFCSLVAFYIKDYTSILSIVFAILILVGSFLSAIVANMGLSRIITYIYNQQVINQYNVKFDSVNQDRLGINLVRNPLFYAKLNKLEKELAEEELYYVNNFNFFSNKRTKEGLLLNIYLRAIKTSNLETLEDNFDYISNEIKQTFKEEDQKILIGVIKNVISANKALIVNKKSKEDEENEEASKVEEKEYEIIEEVIEDDRKKTEEELKKEEERKFLESLDIDDLIPQQKF